MELKAAVSDMHVGNFLFASSRSSITFVKMTDDELNPQIQISAVVDEHFDAHVHVHGKQLNSSHEIWRSLLSPIEIVPTDDTEVKLEVVQLRAKFLTRSSIKVLLKKLQSCKVCTAIQPSGEEKLLDFIRPEDRKICEVDKMGIRSRECQLILTSTDATKCSSCCALRRRLQTRQARAKSNKSCCYADDDDRRYLVRNDYLSSEEKLTKLKELTRKNRNLVNEVRRLKAKLADSIPKRTVEKRYRPKNSILSTSQITTIMRCSGNSTATNNCEMDADTMMASQYPVRIRPKLS